MTVNELISLNNMIVDIRIDVRDNGILIDALRMGPHEGQKPPYPTRVPIKPEYAKNFGVTNNKLYRDATYITKTINAWDDGHDYWEVKPNRLPKGWGDLEVYSWICLDAFVTRVPRRVGPDGRGRNVNFHGERIQIDALPAGQKLEIPKEPKEAPQEMEGQTSIFDFLEDEEC